MQYVQDNDGRIFDSLPHADLDGITRWSYLLTPQHTIDTAHGRLGAYVTDSSIWNCPSASDPHLLDGNTRFPNIFPPYGLNELLARQRVIQGYPPSLAQVQVPAETILAADCAPADDVIQGSRNAEPEIYAPSAHDPWVHGRHNGMANVLWFDGHVTARHPVAAYPVHLQGQGPSVADLEATHMGDILKGTYTGNAQTDDYYYELTKF